MKRLLPLFAMLFAWSQIAQAGGFQIPEMGVKAMGMGNAFTAIADDPTANWFNPAGLGFQKSTAVTVGSLAVIPAVDFTNPTHTAESSADKQLIFIPHAYMTIHTDSNLTAGIGINSPFGLKMKWPTNAVFIGGAQSSQLQTINVNGNVAFKFNDNFSMAAGGDYVNMYKVDFNGTALKQNFTGDGWGYNVAALYKSELFNVGVSYRSSVKIKSKGTSTLTAVPMTVNNTITVTMPDMINIGIAFHPTAQWTVSTDADWVNWKKFNQLAFTYSRALPKIGTSLTVPQNWKATWALRVGTQWAYSTTMRVRIGYTYDPTPIADIQFTPLIPGNDRQGIHVGYGVDLTDHTTLDLAYAYFWLTNRQQTQSAGNNVVRNGTYKTSITLAAASLSYRF
ncbi:MAG: outer membrane protein transport protein [Mariprofundaceae bacterium]|nr:outer membrane protein transport protein [Mariprofundaceae bacterium]